MKEITRHNAKYIKIYYAIKLIVVGIVLILTAYKIIKSKGATA